MKLLLLFLLKVNVLCFFSGIFQERLYSLENQQKPVVVGRMGGQLGNRMFEVASICALAWDNGAEPYFPDLFLDLEGYRHIFFRLNVHLPLSKKITFDYLHQPCWGYYPIPFHPNMQIGNYGQDGRSYGYCHNQKYFLHYRNRLLELFAPNPQDLQYVKQKYRTIFDHPNTVSIHFRSFYTEIPAQTLFMRDYRGQGCNIQLDRDYFEKAMNVFPKSSLFVVTSDNLEMARQNIPTEGRNVIFIEKEEYYIDFLIQRMCHHNIVSNSTFSWWSAWLNQNPNKIVVRPDVWIGGGADIGGPEEWVRIK